MIDEFDLIHVDLDWLSLTAIDGLKLGVELGNFIRRSSATLAAHFLDRASSELNLALRHLNLPLVSIRRLVAQRINLIFKLLNLLANRLVIDILEYSLCLHRKHLLRILVSLGQLILLLVALDPRLQE